MPTLQNSAYLQLFHPSKINQLLGVSPARARFWDNATTRAVPPFDPFADRKLDYALNGVIGRPRGLWPSRATRSKAKRADVSARLDVLSPSGKRDKWLKYVQRRLCVGTRCSVGNARVYTYPNAPTALRLPPQTVKINTSA